MKIIWERTEYMIKRKVDGVWASTIWTYTEEYRSEAERRAVIYAEAHGRENVKVVRLITTVAEEDV